MSQSILQPADPRQYGLVVLRRRDSDPVEARLDRFERRLDDAEDTLATALADERIDDVALQVEHLALTAVTVDDLLETRLEIARLAAEITRVRAELQAELDGVTAALLDVADDRFPRRAAG
jgi:predicted transcriptional regulator